MSEVSVENRDDEFAQPASIDNEEGFTAARSGHVSRSDVHRRRS